MGAHIAFDEVGLQKIKLDISILGLTFWLGWEGEACPTYG